MHAPNLPSTPQWNGKQSLLTPDNCISGLSLFCRQNLKQQNLVQILELHRNRPKGAWPRSRNTWNFWLTLEHIFKTTWARYFKFAHSVVLEKLSDFASNPANGYRSCYVNFVSHRWVHSCSDIVFLTKFLMPVVTLTMRVWQSRRLSTW